MSMEQEEVAPVLKQRFTEWIDKRTALGVEKYGTPLKTFNGRENNDSLEEILDFCQYQEQMLMEAEGLFNLIILGPYIPLRAGAIGWLHKRGTL